MKPMLGGETAMEARSLHIQVKIVKFEEVENGEMYLSLSGPRAAVLATQKSEAKVPKS